MHLTLSKVVSRLKLHRPETAEEILVDCGFPLKFIGSGVFRQVYKIIGVPYVLKVPFKGSETHAATEYRAWKRIKNQARFEGIRQYLPEIVLYQRSSGVVLMPYYRTITAKRYNRQMEAVDAFLQKTLGVDSADVGSDKWDNWGIDHTGQLKLIDLGCIGEDEG